MGAYFGVRKWRNGNPVQDAPSIPGPPDPTVPPYVPGYAPGYVTNSLSGPVVPVPSNSTLPLADISVRSSRDIEVFASPALLPVIVPDIGYIDSDGSAKTAVYGDGVTCTPATLPVATTVNGATSDVPDILVEQGGVEVGTLDPVTGVHTVPLTAPLKFSFSSYDQGSDLWTVTADEAGTYNAYTQDGGSGTITYSKNGGTYTALSGTITLAMGDTIQVRRTTITAAGWSRWQRQVTP